MKKVLFTSLVIITGMVMIIFSCNPSADSPKIPTPPTPTPTPVPVKTLPGSPTGVTVVTGDSSAEVSFVAPVNTGDTLITGYEVFIDTTTGKLATGFKDLDVGTLKTTHRITGLKNYKNYTARVIASNYKGVSPSSTSSAVFTPLDSDSKILIGSVFHRTTIEYKMNSNPVWLTYIAGIAYKFLFTQNGSYKIYTDSANSKLIGNGPYFVYRQNGKTYINDGTDFPCEVQILTKDSLVWIKEMSDRSGYARETFIGKQN